ncbi:sulfurtransferase [Methylibium sp.]|uniref:sulfurtransferase n=1 Tax=Methylibium sp. TaxID=2067992 RepID=UPI00185BD5CE|nr:rhodanese-like domain-containing protein [Methylibium sp.]MBA3592139.1 sulfurtransferase [Methylibium sp.]
MNPKFFSTIALLSGLFATSGAWAAQPLLSPAELEAVRANPAVRILDVRDPRSYAANHIPGAISAPYGSFRGPAGNPGELPELGKLTTLVQSLGLSPATHAVIVSSGSDQTDFGSAARVYWTLKVLGLKELSILNGGIKAWDAANLPQNSLPARVAASDYKPKIDESLVATRDEVRQAVLSDSAQLVDARPTAFFEGETRHQAAKYPGTLKGAVNLEHSRWFEPGSARMVSGDAARSLAASLPTRSQGDTVSFCNTGHWAATNWFALSEVVGQKNVRLYAGSMVDFTQNGDGELVANVPGRAQQLLIDAKLWVERTFN